MRDAKKPRCYRCGKPADPTGEECAKCGAVHTALCGCGATVSLFVEACGACGERRTPMVYRPRRRLLRWGLLISVLCSVALAAYILFPGDPRKRRWTDFDEAWQEYQDRDFESARIKLERYLHEHGEDVRVLLMLGDSLEKLGRGEEGRARLLRALQIDPDLDDAALILAKRAFAADDLAEAEIRARMTIEHEPEPPEAHYLLGRIYSSPGYRDSGAALHHFRRAVDGGIDRVECYVRLAELTLMEQSGPGAELDTEAKHYLRMARERAEALLTEEDADPEALYFLARCDFAAGEYERAERTLRRADWLSEPGAPQRLLLARIHLRLGRAAEAEAVLDELAASGPEAPILLMAADLTRRDGRPDLSSRLTLRAFELYPADPAVVRAHASTLVAAGEAARAEEILRGALVDHPADSRLVAGLAEAVLSRADGAEEGEAILRDGRERFGGVLALRLADLLLDTPEGDPRRDGRIAEAEEILAGGEGPYHLFLSGKLLYVRGAVRAAANLLRDAVEALPGDSAPPLLLAAALRDLGDSDGEAAALGRAMRLSGRTVSQLLRRASAYLRAGKIAEARSDARDALELAPGSEACLVLMAGIERSGDRPDLERAAELLQRAAARPDASPLTHIELARVLRGQGLDRHADREIELAVSSAETPEERARVADALADMARTEGGRPVSDRAREIYEELVETEPENVDLLLRYASLLLALDDPDGARRKAEAVLEVRDKSVSARRILAEAALAGDDGELDEARRLAAEVLALEPNGVTMHYLAGRIALRERDWGRAVSELSMAVTAGPLDLDASHHLALALYHNGEIEEAKAALERLIRLSPRLTRSRRLLAEIATEQARRRLLAGDPFGASELLGEARRRSPGFLPARLLLARSLFEAGVGRDRESLAAARTEAERIIEALGETSTEGEKAALARAWLLLGNVRHAERDWAGLIEACDAYEALMPEDPIANVRKSLALLGVDRRDDAVLEMERAVEKEPESFGIRSLFASILGTLDREDEAFALLEAWTEAHPEDVQALGVLGRACAISGRTDAAESAYRRALDLQPDLLPVLADLVRLLIGAGRAKEAEDTVRAVLAQTDRDPDVTALLGRLVLAREAGSTAGAGLLREALKAGIRHPLYRVGAALLLIRFLSEKEEFEAAAELARLVDSWAENDAEFAKKEPFRSALSEIHFRSGYARSRLGDDEAAVRSYRAAITLDPTSVAALNNLAFILVRMPVSPDEAVSLARRAADAAPESPEVADTLGVALLRAGKTDEAATALTNAIRLFEARGETSGPALARACIHLADSRARVRKFTAARAALEAAAKADPALVEHEDYQSVERQLP